MTARIGETIRVTGFYPDKHKTVTIRLTRSLVKQAMAAKPTRRQGRTIRATVRGNDVAYLAGG